MKKLIFLFSCLIYTQHVHSQTFDYGLKAGLNYSKHLSESEFFETKRKVLFIGGFQSRYNINEKFGLKAEFIFSQAGTKLEGSDGYIALDRLAIPILFQIKVKETLAVGIGGEISQIIGVRSNIGVTKNFFEDNDYGLLAGIEYFVEEDISIDLRYYHGLLFHNEIVLFDEFANEVGREKTDKVSLFSLTVNYYLRKN